jgi:proteasome lid subunit RPN8/RPN11
MSAIRELEEQIGRAAERGDQTRLRELQSRYRKTADVVRITRGPISLAERSAPLVVPEAPPAPEPTGVTLPRAVVIRPEARNQILSWDFESDKEQGGFLVGHETAGQVIVEMVYAARGSNPGGERNRVVLSREWCGAVEERAQRAGWHVVGDVHSHPFSEPRLSATDERGVRGASDHYRRHWVAIVLGQDPDRLAWGGDPHGVPTAMWVKPEWRGHLAVHDPAGIDHSIRPLPVVHEYAGSS